MSRRALVLAHLSSCKPATREMFFGGADLHDHGGAAAGAETQHQQEHSPAPHSAVQFESPPRETTLMPACHSDANMDAAEVGRAWTYNGVRAERSGQQLLLQDMVAMGREELLMKEAEVQKNIVFKANNRDRVGLTTQSSRTSTSSCKASPPRARRRVTTHSTYLIFSHFGTVVRLQSAMCAAVRHVCVSRGISLNTNK